MILILSHFFLFLFIIFFHGYFFSKKILKKNENQNFYEICIIGLLITLLISQTLNFLFPLNNILIILNLFLICVYLLFDKKIFLQFLRFDKFIFSICLLIVISNIYGSGFSDDIDHYHYGYISNSDSKRFIWGNSYLNLLYGTSPIWLTFQSYLNFDFSRLQDIHISNGLILFFTLGLFLSELKSKTNLVYYKPFLFSILMFILLKYTRLKEFGIDRPATLLFCFIIYYYFKYFLNNNNQLIPNFIIISLASISIILIKITYLPILFLPFLFLIKFKTKLFNFDKRYFLFIIPVTIFLLKNILGTGCLIFPLEKTCIELIPWSNHAGARELSFLAESFNKSWTSYTGNLSEVNYVKGFNWFSVWFERGKTEILEITLTIIIILFFSLIVFNVQFQNFELHKKKLKLILFFIISFIFISILIFLFKNPVLRMNHPMLISLMILFLIIFCNFNIKKISKRFLYTIIIFGFVFNFSKNINRISKKEFINNPISEISQKITIPEKKFLNNFEYYQGWYGNIPIGNRDLSSKKHKKIFFFDVLF